MIWILQQMHQTHHQSFDYTRLFHQTYVRDAHSQCRIYQMHYQSAWCTRHMYHTYVPDFSFASDATSEPDASPDHMHCHTRCLVRPDVSSNHMSRQARCLSRPDASSKQMLRQAVLPRQARCLSRSMMCSLGIDTPIELECLSRPNVPSESPFSDRFIIPRRG